MSFGMRAKPQDHKPKAEKPTRTAADEIASLDIRRQAQITNQIDSINRLLKDGSYDEEMACLQAELAEARAKIVSAIAVLQSARVTVKNTIVLEHLNAVAEALGVHDE